MYEAVDDAGRRVALKELVFATVPSVEQVDGFEREAALLCELDHPRIPRFVDRFREGTGVHMRLYLAQEFVEGEDMAQVLARRRMSEDEVVSLAREVLDVLRYLHGLSPRIVHRDVKPANMVRRSDGKLVLVDFDAAREIAPDGTHRATLVGTFGYMPPEQLGGTVDATSDLYALGATMLHLLTRRPPHELMDVARELPEDRLANVSRGLRRILRKMLSPKRDARFQSASEVLLALDVQRDEQEARATAPAQAIGVAAGRGAQPRSSWTPSSQRGAASPRKQSRSDRPILALAVVGVILIGSMTVIGARTPESPRPRTAAETQPDRPKVKLHQPVHEFFELQAIGADKPWLTGKVASVTVFDRDPNYPASALGADQSWLMIKVEVTDHEGLADHKSLGALVRLRDGSGGEVSLEPSFPMGAFEGNGCTLTVSPYFDRRKTCFELGALVNRSSGPWSIELPYGAGVPVDPF